MSLMGSTLIPFPQRLEPFLIQARDQPGMARHIGIFWISSTAFAVNSSILAGNMCLKRNTLCYNWRSHGFSSSTAQNERSLLIHLPDPSKWKLHSHLQLTRETIESATPLITWARPVPARGRHCRLQSQRQPIGSVALNPIIQTTESSLFCDPHLFSLFLWRRWNWGLGHELLLNTR
jgi:hypothetical protein